ncbi:MAG: plasmid partitioning protein RepB [Rhodobacteraceae bacterium]|nr:plasmid partitioning protein RepB [Paracoccaceae bacterium]
MARKDLLKGLLQPPSQPAAPEGKPLLPPRMTKGAIGAVGQSIADLKSRSIIEVPTDMIDNAGLTDRLDQDAEGLAALSESIRIYGQQVPVLLRHSPNVDGRYEVVYGRRRVAALKLAGLPVKAMLRDLTDRDLMIAQGQENSARKDLSFIEMANFARQMRDHGFERAVICDALSIDKTVVSRMLTVADSVPLILLQAIGAAPAIGRDRWLALLERIKGQDAATLASLAQGDSSDARFETLFRATAPHRDNPLPPPALHGTGGARLGHVTRTASATTLTLSHKASPGFGDWLASQIAEIHQRFLQSHGK